MVDEGLGIPQSGRGEAGSAEALSAQAVDPAALLRRLAVFPAGFAPEAAGVVALGTEPIATPGSALWGAAPDHSPPGHPSAALLDALRALAGRGSLVREAGPDGSTRFRVPQALRQDGVTALAAAGELDALHRRHATYTLAFAEAIDRRAWTAEHSYWMAHLVADEADLRAALGWAEEVGETDLGLRLATALWLFWQTRGRVTEGRRWLEPTLAGGEGDSRTRAAALVVAGLLAWLQGDLGAAEALLGDAMELWRLLDFPQGTGRALFVHSLVAWRGGDGPRAIRMAEEALALFRTTGDLAGQPLCQIVLAIAARAMGKPDQALARLEEAVALGAFGAFPWGTAAARYYEGEIRAESGDVATAASAYQASVATSWGLGDPWTTGAGVGGLATIAALRGETTAAARLFGAADALCATAGAFLPVLARDGYERIVAAARVTLGDTIFDRAYEAGRQLPPERAVAEASGVAARVPNGSAGLGGRGPRLMSARELDVLRLLVEGLADGEIASQLDLSARTVSEHVGRMRERLGLPSRTALAVYAVRTGLA